MIVRHNFNDSPINRGDIQTGREKERSNEALARLRPRVLFSDKIVFRSPGYSLWPDRISKLVCNSVNLSPQLTLSKLPNPRIHIHSPHTHITHQFFVWNFNNFSGEKRKELGWVASKLSLSQDSHNCHLRFPRVLLKKNGADNRKNYKGHRNHISFFFFPRVFRVD